MRTYAAALALLLVALAACGTTTPSVTTEPSGETGPAGRTASSDGWRRVDGLPLSPRTDPVVAWTGEEVVVVGGNTGWVCPPAADCAFPTELVADGAAWDPATRTWRAIADAPVPVVAGWTCEPCSATVGGRVVVDASDLWTERWLAYDPRSDAWQELGPPPVDVDLAQHDGTRVWALRGREVVSWDPLSGDVRVERTYDVAPRLDDPRLVLTDVGPVVTGVRYDDVAPDEPTLALADIPDGDGWRRVTSGQVGWFHREVAGTVVGPESGGGDGGEVNGWDRWYPSGGLLDPATGAWEPLDVPEPSGRAQWHVEAYGPGELVTAGHYRDLAAGTGWEWVGRPASELDTELSSTWAGEVLFVLGGVDEERGYDAPSPPEAWTWTPPA